MGRNIIAMSIFSSALRTWRNQGKQGLVHSDTLGVDTYIEGRVFKAYDPGGEEVASSTDPDSFVEALADYAERVLRR